MPELDDAALELRLREVLKEHLGALPLDLTVDDSGSPPGGQGCCPTGRPGPRPHPACGGSPVDRRWGVGGGLRHPAAADRRPAGAGPIGRGARHCVAASDVDTDAHAHGLADTDAHAPGLPVTDVDPEPRPDMDAGPDR